MAATLFSGLKATKAEYWTKLKVNCLKIFFPPEYVSDWEKDHGRLCRWSLQRAAVTPEEAGLIGCWQFIAVLRDRLELRQGKVVNQSQEYSFYATSLADQEVTARDLCSHIRNHWAACENGAHYRRDVTLEEDASQISGRKGAHCMATLRNLVLGLFELRKDKDETPYLPGWQRKMTASAALKLIKNGA